MKEISNKRDKNEIRDMVKYEVNKLKILVLTKEFLYQEYVINNRTALQISKQIGCSCGTVLRKLRKYNIPIKNQSETRKGIKYVTKYSKILTKEFLIKEYIINKKSTVQIAKEIGCSGSTIWEYLRKYDILVRTISEAHIGLSKGKKNGNYTEGSSTYPHYCIDCSKIINWQSKRCPKHASKYMWKDPEFREKTIKAIFAGHSISPNKQKNY